MEIALGNRACKLYHEQKKLDGGLCPGYFATTYQVGAMREARACFETVPVESEALHGGFPKLGVLFGVPIIRTIVYWGLYNIGVP